MTTTSFLFVLALPALASAQDFWANEDGFAWNSAFIWQDGVVPDFKSAVSFQSCVGEVGGKIRIEEATSIGKINFGAGARFAISDGASMTFSRTVQASLSPVSASCESSTSGGEGNPNASTGGDGDGDSSGSNSTLIAAIAAAVAIVLVAAVAVVIVKKRKAAAGGTGGGAQMSFENPMYDSAGGVGGGINNSAMYHSQLNDPQQDDETASQYDELDSGLSNQTSGYMDVAAGGNNGGNNTGGYMDVSPGANDAGYLDVEPEDDGSDDLGGDDV